jgi:cytochrome c oxidase cbb3-type subunit I/II
MTARFVALVAGIFCFFAAVFTQGILTLVEPSARTPDVTAVVRTDLGQLKWMATEATDYTPLQERGRRVYLREGCWYCHSQFVRPVTGETRRWGPVSEAGEYNFDTPHLFGTRRIGPDLTRVGLKYGDEWHYAHFWNARMLTPESIMAPYEGLFDASSDRIKIVDAGGGNRTLEKTAFTRSLFNFDGKEQIKLTPNTDGLLFVPLEAHGKMPLIWTPNKEYTGDAVRIAAETDDLDALIAYVQKLGMNRGKWRDLFEPQDIEVTDVTMPRSAEWIAYGKEVYEARCLGCHGEKGDGNGPAATFLWKQRPRNFNAGEFKFRLTQKPVPTDGDLLRTITRGVRGTAMPAWYELPLNDRLAVIQYIKYVLAVDRSDPAKPYAFFLEEPAGQPLYISTPPAPSQEVIAHGKQVWQNAKCFECHGQTGEGNGEKVESLKDDLGFPIRPANLTSGQFKSGSQVQDIFRTLSTGLSGSPMPSYRDSLPEADRWALAYYVLALSAFKDPLTGQALKISDADRKALDNPTLEANSPEDAYVPGGGTTPHSASASDAASAEPTGALVRTSGAAVPQKSE